MEFLFYRYWVFDNLGLKSMAFSLLRMRKEASGPTSLIIGQMVANKRRADERWSKRDGGREGVERERETQEASRKNGANLGFPPFAALHCFLGSIARGSRPPFTPLGVLGLFAGNSAPTSSRCPRLSWDPLPGVLRPATLCSATKLRSDSCHVLQARPRLPGSERFWTSHTSRVEAEEDTLPGDGFVSSKCYAADT